MPGRAAAGHGGLDPDLRMAAANNSGKLVATADGDEAPQRMHSSVWSRVHTCDSTTDAPSSRACGSSCCDEPRHPRTRWLCCVSQVRMAAFSLGNRDPGAQADSQAHPQLAVHHEVHKPDLEEASVPPRIHGVRLHAQRSPP